MKKSKDTELISCIFHYNYLVDIKQNGSVNHIKTKRNTNSGSDELCGADVRRS